MGPASGKAVLVSAVRPEVSVDKMIQGLELASKLSGAGRMVSGGGSRWPERKRDERWGW